MKGKTKYTGLGIALGAAMGTVFGVMAGHMGVWLAIGVAVGILLGASMRRKGTECQQCAEIHHAHELKDLRKQARS
jgi:hypothetical protein